MKGGMKRLRDDIKCCISKQSGNKRRQEENEVGMQAEGCGDG